MMMALCSISDPGLVLLPTHRILKHMPVDAAELERRLSQHFRVSRIANRGLMKAISATRAIGVALPGGDGLVAQFDSGAFVAQIPGEGGDDVKRLDVSVLHGFIFERVLGLTGLNFFDYTRVEQEALDAVEHGSPAAFLMNPPTVQDMRTVAAAGDFMPQKSTYYYPKLLSGLVVWSLKDFQQ
jgi:uncharacterized protein (DUF1015 family)